MNNLINIVTDLNQEFTLTEAYELTYELARQSFKKCDNLKVLGYPQLVIKDYLNEQLELNKQIDKIRTFEVQGYKRLNLINGVWEAVEQKTYVDMINYYSYSYVY